ncbi:MAG TPA: tetratricopeptide repeat protein [Candidatus Cloacimonadota bacterium]|nr:tetratricopeptide repeat protein [Candidatus Cloacimonadota bacterium]HOV15933.1 tetratricopeptide repeat protein [Candidatus Cloacimonadota bacterium]HQL14272.1 tetratricopeptide repeat protein [Candidatus Cloacimonadota bacterium]
MSKRDLEINNILLQAEALVSSNWLHAIHILKKATEDYPRERSLYLTMGDIYMRQRNFEQAIGSYQKALILDPKDEYLKFIMGNCYLSLNDYKMALYYYDQVSFDTPEMYYNKALAYAYDNEHELSIHYLKLLLRQVNDNLNVYYFLVEEMLRLHKYEDAIKQLDEMEKHLGIHQYEQILKGIVWNFKKNWLKSYMAFKTADELSPLIKPDHLQYYAQACYHIGKIDQGIQILEKAITVNPYISILHEELLRLYLQKEDLEAAEKTLNRALVYVDKNNPILLLLKAKIFNLKTEKEIKLHNKKDTDD